MLQRILIVSIALVLTQVPAIAAFVPDPTPPPVITQGTGTRYVPKVDRGAPRQTEGAGSR
jgi:hypothetical protein